MKHQIALGLLLTILWAVPSQGTFYSGNELKQICDTSKRECSGFVIGVVDMIIISQLRPDVKQTLCLPSNVDSVQITDIVVSYIEANPKIRHLPAAALVWNSAIEAFACKNAK